MATSAQPRIGIKASNTNSSTPPQRRRRWRKVFSGGIGVEVNSSDFAATRAALWALGVLVGVVRRPP